LGDVAGVEFSSDARQVIRGVQEKRNRLQHYGLTDSAPAIQAVAIGALNFLISFVTKELADALTEDANTNNSLVRIRQQLAGIAELVSVRLRDLVPALDARDVIVECPSCTQLALEPGDRCVCHFCGASDAPEMIALEYVYGVLGESEYTAAKGRTDWSLGTCPDCEQETLVKGVVVRRHSVDKDGPLWVCFAQAVAWRPNDMDECLRCGRPILYDKDGYGLCPDCLEAALDRF
jgi:hypothetical protein